MLTDLITSALSIPITALLGYLVYLSWYAGASQVPGIGASLAVFVFIIFGMSILCLGLNIRIFRQAQRRLDAKHATSTKYVAMLNFLIIVGATGYILISLFRH